MENQAACINASDHRSLQVILAFSISRFFQPVMLSQSGWRNLAQGVEFTEGPLEVLEIEVDDPIEVEPISKKPRLISSEYFTYIS